MDVDELHFIPKVTTTSTTPATASTPSSRLPSVLTSLDIPPAYLEEILRPRSPPKVTRDPPQQEPPSPQIPPEEHSRDPPIHRQAQEEAPAPQSPPGGYPRDHYTVEVKGNDHKTVWYRNTSLLNAPPQNGSQELKGLKPDSSIGPKVILSSSEGFEGNEEGGDMSRWRWGWWNEEPSDVQQRREELSSGPRFDRTLARKVVVQEGKTAVMACRVVNNNEKAVRMPCLYYARLVTDV